MSIIFEGIQCLYRKYATLANFGHVMSFVTPLFVLTNQLFTYCKSYKPSYVERIIHFDTENGKITEKYIAWKNRYSIKNGLYELMGLPKDGYYMIVVWNNMKLSYEHYILQANLVEKALEIKNIYNLWTLHDDAIVFLLSNYISYTNISTGKILGIALNKEDVTRILKPFMKCINLPKNIRPNVLYMLTKYLNKEPIDKDLMVNSTCIYTNEDMDKININKANQYLSSSPNSYPIYHSCYEHNEHDEHDEHDKHDERDLYDECYKFETTNTIEELYEKDKDM